MSYIEGIIRDKEKEKKEIEELENLTVEELRKRERYSETEKT